MITTLYHVTRCDQSQLALYHVTSCDQSRAQTVFLNGC
ncbi:unnamed protein product [Staurois parvus]|uniref:Uncharacterized protein n=1 Tax=Staurois parvus TaxID=386267 RepID=A0ABN9D021_9NEOB|nr:unnamed protein product [Staurois parvus]